MKKHKQKQLGYILAVAIGSSAAMANAAMTVDLVNTLGETGLQNGEFSFAAGDTNASLAAQFSTGSLCPMGCTLGDVTLFMLADDPSNTGQGPATAGNYLVEIFDNNSGTGRPGTSIATMSNPQSIIADEAENVFTAPAAPVTLADDTEYWLKFTSTGSGEDVSWLFPTGTNLTTGNWILNTAFGEVIGDGTNGTNAPPLMKVQAVSTIPIPSSFILLGSALIGLITSTKRRKIA